MSTERRNITQILTVVGICHAIYQLSPLDIQIVGDGEILSSRHETMTGRQNNENSWDGR